MFTMENCYIESCDFVAPPLTLFSRLLPGYINFSDNHDIEVFDHEGLKFVHSFEIKGPSTHKLCKPRGICVGNNGLVY